MLRETELRDFEHLTKRFFGRGFASLTKTEVEVYLFDIYMRGVERSGGDPSYYAIGRELGISESRVRTLSEKRPLYFYEPPSAGELSLCQMRETRFVCQSAEDSGGFVLVNKSDAEDTYVCMRPSAYDSMLVLAAAIGGEIVVVVGDTASNGAGLLKEHVCPARLKSKDKTAFRGSEDIMYVGIPKNTASNKEIVGRRGSVHPKPCETYALGD